MSKLNLDCGPIWVFCLFFVFFHWQIQHMCWITEWNSFSFSTSALRQHGLGFLHLLHGRIRHHHQLLHQDRHRVQAQAQDLRAEHPRGARARGFRIFPRTLRALHLQIRGRVFQPDAEKRQENPHTCRLAGPKWHRGVSGGGTVLSGGRTSNRIPSSLWHVWTLP